MNAFFYPLYMLRRLAYVSVVWLVAHPVFQLYCMIVINFVSLVFVGYNKPLRMKMQNWVECYNQLSIVLVTVLMCTFTEWVPSREVRFNYGIAVIIIICCHLFITLIIIYYWLVRHCLVIAMKLYNYIVLRLQACGIRKKVKFDTKAPPPVP